MSRVANIPIPAEFDDSSYDEKAEYIEALLDRLEAEHEAPYDAELVELAKRRLAMHRADPERAVSADEAKARLLSRYQ